MLAESHIVVINYLEQIKFDKFNVKLNLGKLIFLNFTTVN